MHLISGRELGGKTIRGADSGLGTGGQYGAGSGGDKKQLQAKRGRANMLYCPLLFTYLFDL